MSELSQLLSLSSDLTAGSISGWVLVAMFGTYLIREWRETRKLSAEDRLARREGYAKQVELLMAELRARSADLEGLRREYDAHRRQCFDETDQLRHDVQRLEEENAGLKRNHALLSIELARLKGTLPAEFDPERGKI